MPIFRASFSDAMARLRDRRTPAAGFALASLLCASVLVLGCGKAGPPVPPEPRSPLPPTEVTAAQNGPLVRVRGRIAPPRGTRSSQLPVRVELWRADLISDLADENDLESFRRMGRLVQSVEGDPLVAGRFYELVDPLELEVASKSLKKKFRYALRVIDKRGRATPWVATPAMAPVEDQLAPAELKVAAMAEGIVLTWPAGPDPTGMVAVYRRIVGSQVPPERVGLVERKISRYLDTAVTTGAKYEYRLRMLLTAEEPRREGSDGPTRVQLAEDLFAPATPGGLVAVQEGAAIRLFWNPNDEPDLGGYNVYRKSVAGDWEPLMAQAIQDTTWLDEDAPYQVELQYRITAVDKNDPPNESEACEPVVMTSTESGSPEAGS